MGHSRCMPKGAGKQSCLQHSLCDGSHTWHCSIMCKSTLQIVEHRRTVHMACRLLAKAMASRAPPTSFTAVAIIASSSAAAAKQSGHKRYLHMGMDPRNAMPAASLPLSANLQCQFAVTPQQTTGKTTEQGIQPPESMHLNTHSSRSAPGVWRTSSRRSAGGPGSMAASSGQTARPGASGHTTADSHKSALHTSQSMSVVSVWQPSPPVAPATPGTAAVKSQ